MGTRTSRIPSNHLQEQKASLLGKTIQIVFWAGSTKTGRVESVDDSFLTLIDGNTIWYNRKRHTHQISLEAIREILVDEVVEW